MPSEWVYHLMILLSYLIILDPMIWDSTTIVDFGIIHNITVVCCAFGTHFRPCRKVSWCGHNVYFQACKQCFVLTGILKIDARDGWLLYGKDNVIVILNGRWNHMMPYLIFMGRANPVDDVLIGKPLRANMTCQCQYDMPMPIWHANAI